MKKKNTRKKVRHNLHKLNLQNGGQTFIDIEDMDFVLKYKWSNANGYAMRWSHIGGKRTRIQLHRELLNPPDEMQIDHINHDRADNRWVNLRQVSNAENSRNRIMCTRNKSGHTGVCWDKATNKWKSQIGFDGQVNRLGTYENIDDAIMVRQIAEEVFGFHENHGQ